MFNNLRYLLLFALIFGFFASVWAFDYYSVYEEDTDNLEFLVTANDDVTYPDGTALMHFVRHDNASNQFENNLYIRLLHPNGTLTKFTVPTYNFTKYQPHAFPLNDGYMLITQANDDNMEHGTLVDWSGQVLQR